MTTAAAVRTAEREEARTFLRTAEASVLEARGFSAAVSKELENKVGELHEAKAELKAARKAVARAKMEAEGRVREAAEVPLGCFEPGAAAVVDSFVVGNSGGLTLPAGATIALYDCAGCDALLEARPIHLANPASRRAHVADEPRPGAAEATANAAWRQIIPT